MAPVWWDDHPPIEDCAQKRFDTFLHHLVAFMLVRFQIISFDGVVASF